jgi:uncharacterized protein YjcR
MDKSIGKQKNIGGKGMKKKERKKGVQEYLKSEGKIKNKDLADRLGVNPLTVGRWKKEDNWDQELKDYMDSKRDKSASKSAPKSKRAQKKPEELELAKKIYLDADGAISNTALAKAVNVTPVTIAKWKKDQNWSDYLRSFDEEEMESDYEEETVDDYDEVEELEGERLALEEGSIDTEPLDGMLAPEQISVMNQKIQRILEREHLSAQELAHLAEAKADLLEGVQTYLNILQDISNFGF